MVRMKRFGNPSQPEVLGIPSASDFSPVTAAFPCGAHANDVLVVVAMLCHVHSSDSRSALGAQVVLAGARHLNPKPLGGH